MMTDTDGLTGPQQAAVTQFRAFLGNEVGDDTDRELGQWLKAEELDAHKAALMYIKSKRLKKQMRVDKILEEYTPPEVLAKYYPGGCCGFDKEGSLVKVELFGNTDWQGLMSSLRKSDFEKYTFWVCEKNYQTMKEQCKMGVHVDQVIVIQDMCNTSLIRIWKPGIDMYLHMVRLAHDNYPEYIKTMYLINCPTFFPIVWEIAKRTLSERILDKIIILTGDFQEVLLQTIDADQLPMCYGGNLVDPVNGHPNCPSLICQGGEVPTSYFLSKDPHLESLGSVEIQPRKYLSVECQVTVPNSVIKYEFYTTGNDLAFGILYQPETMVDHNTETETMVPIQRVNCHHRIEDGILVCERTGRYMVIFDNRYSLLRSKTLRYNIDLFSGDLDTDLDLQSHLQQCTAIKLVHSTQQRAYLWQLYPASNDAS